MKKAVPVIDVFAGPGGLNEGFSSYGSDRGAPAFETAASIEMDHIACETLVLRAAVRRWRREGDGELPDRYYAFLRGEIPLPALEADEQLGVALKAARAEVNEFQLAAGTRDDSDGIIRQALAGAGVTEGDPWVLIGGPPCQAYSLAGRSRRANDVTFKDDHKHTLYREYLHIIQRFRPAVFVMENVKGMLSSTHDGGPIFERIMQDLRGPDEDYEIRSFVTARSSSELVPDDFVIRAEDHGVPQRRHRVILLGIRKDYVPGRHPALRRQAPVTVRQVIGDFPRIRSRVNPRRSDDVQTWSLRFDLASGLYRQHSETWDEDLSARALAHEVGGSFVPGSNAEVVGSPELRDWLVDPRLDGLVQHDSRGHMLMDLSRYAYCSLVAHHEGRSPHIRELPEQLLPNHKNARLANVPFGDRFRVQVWDRPSTTVVSHIAKDGNYYIHPDPRQMRSFSVREAARLQTFPDNYFFMGNRTQQYHQVGNAVPPYLAFQLAEVVAEVLGLTPGR